jgi:cytochrome c-type biogenesis protein CcmF
MILSLVRSGILESIHAFGDSTVGGPLLVLIATVIIGSAALIVSRLDVLRSERRIESLASRESVFLVNNLLLVGLVVVIFWGTFFPLISEAVTGEKSSLGPVWFDRYTMPLAVLLVLFTGIGPLLAWRRISAGTLWRLVRGPLVVAAIGTGTVIALTDALSHPAALVLFAFAFFALAALVSEFWRGAEAQRALSGGGFGAALVRVVSRNRRRYGGYVVHAGIAILFMAVAASSSFQTSRDLRMVPGDTAQVDDYTVTYVKPTASIDSEEQKLTFGATLAVERDGKRVTVLHPSRNYYSNNAVDPTAGPLRSFFEGEATSEVGRRAGVTGDLWTAMRPDFAPLDPAIDAADRRLVRSLPDVGPQGPTPEQIEAMRSFADRQGEAIGRFASLYLATDLPVDFRVNVNPFVIWIWIGGAIGILGALVAVWPAPDARRRRVSDVYAARLARELGRA